MNSDRKPVSKKPLKKAFNKPLKSMLEIMEKAERIDKEFFIRNRRLLVKKMEPNSVAVLGGNYPLYTNGDGVLPYIPNHDLWYFTGIEQDETVLLIEKNAKRKGGHEETLFILPRSPGVEVWDGQRLTHWQAQLISGIENVTTTSNWEDLLQATVCRNTSLYFNFQEHSRAPLYRNRNHDLYDHCRKHFPLHHYRRLAPLIHSLRMIKSVAEVAEIRRATWASREALEKILPLLRGGISEKDIEAEMMSVYVRHGGPAFSPIVASGKNSCILHYIVNREKLKAGELILIDSGARGGITRMYPADITRVFPIRETGGAEKNRGGEFTPRQRQVYESVLRVLKEAATLIKPGVKIDPYRKKTLSFIKREILSLGLLKKKDLADPNAHLKYFMHGISHWLGLDVHDVGNYEGEFVEGMTLTCEPGIYIPEEGFGIRLENNYWIKSKRETVNLSEDIPLEVDEVYRWMAKTQS